MNKKGAATDLFIWMIVGFVLVVVGGLFLFGWNLITTSLISVQGTSTVNVSSAAQTTFGSFNEGFSQLKYFSFIIILAMGVSILLSNFLIRVNPVFFIFYVILVIIAIIVSMQISNSYEMLLNNGGVVAQSMADFVGSSWLMLHLPVWVTVIGMLGGVIQMVGILRDSEQGGGFI